MFTCISSNRVQPLRPQACIGRDAKKSNFLAVWTGGSFLITKWHTAIPILWWFIFIHGKKRYFVQPRFKLHNTLFCIFFCSNPHPPRFHVLVPRLTWAICHYEFGVYRPCQILVSSIHHKHEEDESAIRQMRKKFRNQHTGKTSSTAQLTDSCFCCHKLVSVNIVGTLCWLLGLPMLVCKSWWVKMINNIGRMRRWARSEKKKVSSVSVPPRFVWDCRSLGSRVAGKTWVLLLWSASSHTISMPQEK